MVNTWFVDCLLAKHTSPAAFTIQYLSHTKSPSFYSNLCFSAPLLLSAGSIAPIAPCRASASPIDKRVAFFFVTGKPTVARNAADSALEVSVSFQSIANSEPWWSPNVHNGQRLGLVARHMSRRTRVQGKAVGGSSGGDSHGSSGGGVSPAGAAAGSSSAGGGGTDELHGYQGRWFCLVQAPCHLIGDKPVKLKCAKAVPGAFSLVQVSLEEEN